MALFYTVIPGFIDVLAQMEVELPLVTRLVFGVATSLQNPGVWLVGVAYLAALYGWLKDSYRNREAGQLLFSILMRVPVLGGLLQTASVARYTAAAGAMLDTGMSLVKTMRLSARASGNPLLTGDSVRLIKAVQDGEHIYVTMMQRPDLYPTPVTQMVRAGEETSRLADMFERVSGYYSSELGHRIETLGALLEPILLAGVASSVGVLVLSIFLLMYGYLAKLGG